MRLAVAQIISSADLADNLELIREYATRAKAAGAELVVFPEAAMRAFGNTLADIAEPLDGPWASGGPRHCRGTGHRGRGRHVHPRGGRTRAQHPAGDRPRRRHLLRQDPPFRCLRVCRVRFGGRRNLARDLRTERHRHRPRHLLRRALPRTLHGQRPGRRPGQHRLRVLGRRRGKGRAVGSAGPRPRRGQHHVRGGLRTGRPRQHRPSARRLRPHRHRPQRRGVAPWLPRWLPSAANPNWPSIDIDPTIITDVRGKLPVLANARSF